MKISTLLFSVLLSTLILYNSIRVSATYAYYELDPIGFIEALCENQDKPELACKGKCQLMKASADHSNNNQNPTKIIDFKEVLLYIDTLKNFEISVYLKDKKHQFVYSNLYKQSYLSLVNPPPRA